MFNLFPSETVLKNGLFIVLFSVKIVDNFKDVDVIKKNSRVLRNYIIKSELKTIFHISVQIIIVVINAHR